ncbi:MAG: hypothetical protein M1814_005095 [Vezdaea aestivalis]|nr:MAG: hypothetical protein M1814_005095 [Vezdaea aestivalis]
MSPLPPESDSPSPSIPDTRPARYRSVRRGANQQVESSASPPPPLPSDGIARSMSRYRRNRPTSSQPTPVPPLPSNQRTPRKNSSENPFKTPPSTSHGHTSDGDRPDLPVQGSKGLEARTKELELGSPGGEERHAARVRQYRDREAQRKDRDERAGRQQAGEAPLEQEESLRVKKDRNLLHRLSHRALDKTEQLPSQSAGEKDKSGFFSRIREKRTPPTSPKLAGPKPAASPSKRDHKPIGIEPGGGGIVPGTDAPVSAVNAGERRVSLKCDDKVINLPVTPDTTPVDLIRSAANILSENIIPDQTVLLEAYVKVGLERPLRKYERVRDVLNSWDRDSSNHLLLVPADGESNREELDVSNISTEEPEDISVLINYSQVPGKWKKQWITLRSDGQMLTCKKEGAKDVTNVCHMSDFDIYTPTKAQLKKVIRPGKKHCFAVKSQEKSTMFMTQTTFVHFFATDDRKLAGHWYRAIHSWRSWYMVHKLGAGRKTTVPAAIMDPSPRKVTAAKPPQHRTQLSEDSFYQIGSFKPLLTTEEFTQTTAVPQLPAAFSEQLHTDTATRKTSNGRAHRKHSPPPASYPRRLHLETSQQHSKSRSTSPNRDSKPDPTFAPTSLLGRTYTQRQAAARTRDSARSSTEGPFVSGTTLLSSGIQQDHLTTSRSKSIKHDSGHVQAGLHREKSTRQKPQPLLNFDDPEIWQPPQHRGKGRGVKAEPSSALVDSATTPEVAIPIPPRETWRRPGQNQAAAMQQPSRYRSSASRRAKEVKTDPFADPVPSSGARGRPSAEHEEEVFTGLLARTGQGWGDGGKGRGVMTGNREADRPMLDLREGSRFAPGSLLATVEGQEFRGPIIDREKPSNERVVNVGEGVR